MKDLILHVKRAGKTARCFLLGHKGPWGNDGGHNHCNHCGYHEYYDAGFLTLPELFDLEAKVIWSRIKDWTFYRCYDCGKVRKVLGITISEKHDNDNCMPF